MSVLFPKLRVKTRNLRKALSLSAEAFSVELPLKYELAALLKFRDAAHCLREWIEFHRVVGVEHFYLYPESCPIQARRRTPPMARARIHTPRHEGHPRKPGPRRQAPRHHARHAPQAHRALRHHERTDDSVRRSRAMPGIDAFIAFPLHRPAASSQASTARSTAFAVVFPFIVLTQSP